MQISISNLCEPGDENLWRNPGLTLTPSVRPCPCRPQPPSDFHQISPFHPTLGPLLPPTPTAGGLRPGAHLTDSCWFGSLHHTPDKRGIQDSFLLLPLLHSSLQSPAQTQFPGTGLLQGLLMKSFPAHMIGRDCHPTIAATAAAAAAAAMIPTLPSHLRSPIPHLHWVYSCGNSKWLCAFSVCIHPSHVCVCVRACVCVCTSATRVMCVCVGVCS